MDTRPQPPFRRMKAEGNGFGGLSISSRQAVFPASPCAIIYRSMHLPMSTLPSFGLPISMKVEQQFSSSSRLSLKGCSNVSKPIERSTIPQCRGSFASISYDDCLDSETIPVSPERARTQSNVDLLVAATYKPHTMLANSARRASLLLPRRPYICRTCLRRAENPFLAPGQISRIRCNQTAATRLLPSEDAPFRKALKDAAKQKKIDERASGKSKKKASKAQDVRLEKWELTVGIEIHAELNTARKLFSSAATSTNATPNTHVSLFDAAFPGTQPQFQKETLLPALRAALALNCEIQHRSSFDRKHYFYQDQPAGYQITQYYGGPAPNLPLYGCLANSASQNPSPEMVTLPSFPTTSPPVPVPKKGPLRSVSSRCKWSKTLRRLCNNRRPPIFSISIASRIL